MKPYIHILYSLICCLVFTFTASAQEPAPIPVIPNTAPSNPGGTPEIINKEVLDALRNKGSNATTPTSTTTDTEAESSKSETDIEDKKKEEEELEIKFDERQSELPQAKIWGQQFFRDQSISLFTRSRDIKAIDKYLLGIGDELTITVYGQTDYSAKVAINEEGFINLSNPGRGTHIPRLYIRGMKFSAAQKAIISRLGNHMNIKNSQIDIELNYTRSLTINITGEVFNPGSYTMPAVNTAFNALVAAGGPSQIGSVRLIKVVSSEQDERILDIYKFMNNPKVADEFFLQNNDYVYVPLAERVVEITGAIERPFFYELVGGENLIELLEHAGGLRPDAYKRNIQILRYANDEEKLIDVNLTKLIEEKGDFVLEDGDRISISPIEQAFANYITVTGAVKIPGTYQLEENSRVRDVLKKSGIIRSAIMERIYLKRLREDLSVDYLPVNVFEVLDNPESPDNLLLRPFDELEVKYKADFIDKYSVKIFGAVRQPGSFEYSDSLVLKDIIYMANGIKLSARNSTIEVSRLMLDNQGNKTYITLQAFSVDGNLKVQGAESFYLEPYDQVFVRQSKEFTLPQNVQVSGQIRLPGIYTMLDKDDRVLDLIKRAGGVTDAAFLEGTKLIREGDGLILLDLKELLEDGEDSRYNYILEPKDRIIIPIHKNLVSIAGRVNHPLIKETAEIEEMKLELELEKVGSSLIEQKELLLQREMDKRESPAKINIPYHKGKNALFYIKEYGAGIDRKLGGRNRLVYVRYANGAVKKTKSFLFFKKYPIVEEGAMIYVDERKIKAKNRDRKPIDWYNVIRDTFAIISSGLTIYALISALSR